jgi:hypothetical protein
MYNQNKFKTGAYKMKVIVLTIMLIALTSCMASMPNHIKQEKSSFDGSTQYIMEPGFIYESADFTSWGSFKLGLSWQSQAPDIIVVTALIPNKIINISSKNGLQFNVDGEIVVFNSNEFYTSIDVKKTQSVRFIESNKQVV